MITLHQTIEMMGVCQNSSKTLMSLFRHWKFVTVKSLEKSSTIHEDIQTHGWIIIMYYEKEKVVALMRQGSSSVTAAVFITGEGQSLVTATSRNAY